MAWPKEKQKKPHTFLEKKTKRLDSTRSNIWVIQTIAGVAMDPPQIKVVGESLEPALVLT